jgi:hypothetical protein
MAFASENKACPPGTLSGWARPADIGWPQVEGACGDGGIERPSGKSGNQLERGIFRVLAVGHAGGRPKDVRTPFHLSSPIIFSLSKTALTLVHREQHGELVTYRRQSTSRLLLFYQNLIDKSFLVLYFTKFFSCFTCSPLRQNARQPRTQDGKPTGERSF